MSWLTSHSWPQILCRRSNVLVLCCLALTFGVSNTKAESPPAKPRIDFATASEFGVRVQGRPSSSLWKREVMRQTLLLAAREELSYRTGDNGLGEPLSRTRPSIELKCVAGAPNRIQVLNGVPDKREEVWAQTLAFDAPWPHQRAWVEQMEVLSRTGFVDALKKSGFAAREKPKVTETTAEREPALTRLIDEDLTFLGQYLAIRQLHEAIASNGETPDRLAGIVRGYSHLGVLTEYLWHPMSYSFKARALLYAQRWAVREPKSKAALQHRAYAFALVGMHGDALADLEAASKLSSSADAPDWLPLVEHFCRYDFTQLKKQRDNQPIRPLATLLCFLAYEQESSSNQIVTVGLELLKDSPDSYRMLDTLCHHTGPGVGNLVTHAGPMHLATTLLPRMAGLDELPAHVREVLDEAKASGALLDMDSDEEDVAKEASYRAELIRSLRGFSREGKPAPPADTSEPSWAVLAKIIEETSFLQIFHRAYFVRFQIGVPVDDYVEMHRPIFATHRHAKSIDRMLSNAQPEGELQLSATFLDFAHARMWLHWPRPAQVKVETIARANKELLPNELGLAARFYPYEGNVGPGPMLAVSPHSPFAMAAAARASSGSLPDKKWEEKAEESPYLAWTFAEIWKRRGDRAKTEEFLKLSVKLDPSPSKSRQLASFYKEGGDEKNWLKVLDECLKTPSVGLEHAQIQCEIAQYYAYRREWDKALPYADAAGETGAQWAMTWARNANEANQNWETAEQHFVDAIGRYGEHPIEWYLFCKRNGVGNLGLAREATFPEGVEAFAAIPNVPVNYAVMALYLEAKPSKALESREKEAEALPSSFSAMQCASMADRLGERARRDKWLGKVVEQKAATEHPYDQRPHREELIELARLFIADLAAGGKSIFDFEKVHALRDKAAERDRCTFNYFLGCYLDDHGKPELAVDYWKLCMGNPELGLGTRTLAGAELVRRKIKPEEWKSLLMSKPAK
jgi:hypothetical protein